MKNMSQRFLQDIVKQSKCILLDIEGTTTSIDFVKEKLFPYAKENFKGFLSEHWNDENVLRARDNIEKYLLDEQLPNIVSNQGEGEISIDEFVVILKKLMDADLKITGLKAIQGFIWKDGYMNGEICGHFYGDTITAFRKWKCDEKKIFIYSSGSIEAQKLLFKYSNFGDIQKYIDGNFDTCIGLKQEPTSYLKILKSINEKASDVVFFTDMPNEIHAAKSCGMKAILMVRSPEKTTYSDSPFFGEEDGIIFSFDEVSYGIKF